ncbi:MAG: YceI family protein [Proteobacteria bacterium]|nr:YceI family protein [Pseudomonadota bacterium]MDA0926595.1 YceI family protein [Pseudomonadota bacterium]
MKMTRILASTSTVLVASLFSSLASAHWSLNNDASTLSFVTVKAEHVAEVHTFDVLSGEIADDGSVEITIELASVNTLIPIRNERMQAMLFETNMFPEATITADIDLDGFTAMTPGASEAIQLNFSLNMRETSRSYTADVLVTRLENGLVASTLKPVVVTAEQFDLITGVEALREVAGLPSISRAVPVSFTVVFDQGH